MFESALMEDLAEMIIYYRKQIKLLMMAKIQTYHMEAIGIYDDMITFTFTLTTDIGIFRGENVNFTIVSRIDKMILAFHPGFENVLKELLVVHIADDLDLMHSLLHKTALDFVQTLLNEY